VRQLDIGTPCAEEDGMKLRKGVVPLILFAIAAAAYAIYAIAGQDRVPMEKGESVFSRP
jgi:hypothetical protein